MKYIQFANSLQKAKEGSHQVPELLLIDDGNKSKLLYSNVVGTLPLDTKIEVDGSTIPVATFRKITCLAKGTKITMSDNSTKKVEEIIVNDKIISFNHETGEKEVSNICIAYKGNSLSVPLILHFKSGKTLSIVGTHSILEQSSLKYVQISEDTINNYINKNFYDALENNWDELISFEIGTEPIEFFSIYSMNINCITNGFLTAPDDVDYELNIYEMDLSLKANMKQLSDDINKYGLLNVQEKCSEHPEVWDIIYALGKYIYIAIGKGLTTLKYAESLYKFWDE